MKYLRLIFKIWEFVSRLAWVITKLDEAIEQYKCFRDWLFDDEPIEPEKEK